MIGFWDTPMEETYFEPLNHYCATGPDSRFMNERLVNRRTPHGSLSITGRTMTEHRDGEIITTPLDDNEALSAALSERFGICFPASGLRTNA